MDEKITFSQLCNMVALRSKMSRTTTEDFLRELFSMVSQSLAEGDSVKLKGIGTFKVQKVGVRKSVDVTTGKEIIIPEHSKITYTPSKELAIAVNSPFEAFEAVEISDELSDEEMDENGAAETTELQSVQDELPIGLQIEHVKPDEEPEAETPVFEKLGGEPNGNPEVVGEESNNENVEAEVEKAADTPIVMNDVEAAAEPTDDPEPIAEVPEISESESHEAEQETETDNNAETEPEQETEPEPEPESQPVEESEQYAAEVDDEDSEAERKKKRRSKAWIIALSTLAVVACAFIALLLLYPDMYSSLTGSTCGDNAHTEQVAQATPQTKTDRVEATSDKTEAEATAATPDAEKEKLMPETTPSDAADNAVKVVDTITKTRYLTTMAKEHYGNFHFWPYIYKENEAFLGHPDRIKPGTEVVVPPLSKYGVDPKNKKDEKEAIRLGAEIYKKYNK